MIRSWNGKRQYTIQFKQLLSDIGTNYALANDMNIMVSYINGCNSPDRINDYFNSKVARFLKELNKLSEDATQT